MVSKACLVGAYQIKLEAIANHDDVDLTVIVPPSWDDPTGRIPLERGHVEGYRLIVDPIRFNGNYHLHYYPKLSARLSEIQPDILHMDEEPYNLATWLAIRAAKKRGVNSLFFSWQNINRRYPFPFRQLESQTLRMTSYGIVGNRASGEVWRQKGYAGKLAVIPQFGINPDLFTPPISRDAGRGLIIGVAGRRLVAEKGIDTLLEAAAALPGIWQIRIAGEGPERSKLQTLAKQLKISDRVFFEGTLPSQRVPAFMRQLDILALPSRTLPNWKEQFGRVLIEAMACQVAVVGSDSGEIPNVISDAGLIFPEGDVAALADCLRRLMVSPQLRLELGEKGRQRALKQYTQSQIAAKTVAVYREIIDH